jgi:transposase-like protein
MKETLRHRQAYDYYFKLGDGNRRNLHDVAQKFSVTETTVRNWRKAFGWDERMRQREIEVASELERKTNTTIINTKAEHRDTVAKMLNEIKVELGYLTRYYGTAKEPLEKGTLKIDNRVDFTETSKAMQAYRKLMGELIRLDLFLMGEADSRPDVSASINLDVMTDDERGDFIRAAGRIGIQTSKTGDTGEHTEE